MHVCHNLGICLIRSRMFDKQLSVHSSAVTAKLPIHAAGTTFNGTPCRIAVLTRFAGVCNSKVERTTG